MGFRQRAQTRANSPVASPCTSIDSPVLVTWPWTCPGATAGTSPPSGAHSSAGTIKSKGSDAPRRSRIDAMESCTAASPPQLYGLPPGVSTKIPCQRPQEYSPTGGSYDALTGGTFCAPSRSPGHLLLQPGHLGVAGHRHDPSFPRSVLLRLLDGPPFVVRSCFS